MIAWTIYITFAGALGLLFMPRFFTRWIALATAVAGFVIALLAFFQTPNPRVLTTIVRATWIPVLGSQFHLAADGISLTLALVTGLTAVSAVLFSWDVDHRPNEFFFWLLLVIGGSYGVFLSPDLFLFFVFY
jgi:NADH-quinone oxidoreductase subunit M